MENRPRARTTGVVVERIDDELVIYDQRSQTAHSLSAAAASVWERCDGQRSSVEIAGELSLEPEMAERALGELRGCGLLEGSTSEAPGYSRREATAKLAKIGGAAFAAPLIYSVAIGPAMAAASCSANGHTCTTNANCCSGHCDGTTCNTCCSNGNSGCCTTNADCCKSGATCGTAESAPVSSVASDDVTAWRPARCSSARHALTRAVRPARRARDRFRAPGGRAWQA